MGAAEFERDWPVNAAALVQRTRAWLLVDRKVALLLNGWNEIAADDKGRAVAGADDFLGGHAGALVVCTSRRDEGPFAASGAAVVGDLNNCRPMGKPTSS
jgi:hypothetical protein